MADLSEHEHGQCGTEVCCSAVGANEGMRDLLIGLLVGRQSGQR
jgi:hypothetical protein